MATGLKRMHILGVPVDLVNDDDLPDIIDSLFGMTNLRQTPSLHSLSDHRQIVLLNFHDFMKSRHNVEYITALKRAAMIIPISRLINFAVHFIAHEDIPRRRAYPFIIQLLGILEKKHKSIYLLGSTKDGIRSAERTLRETFPYLHIVGRHSVKMNSKREDDVVIAIKKSAPSLLLTGKGLKGNFLWISRNRERFSPGLGIWEKDCFDVFSGKRSTPNDTFIVYFIKKLFGLIIRPWRVLLVFRYILYFILIFIERQHYRFS